MPAKRLEIYVPPSLNHRVKKIIKLLIKYLKKYGK
jgi:hypothetical protein